jgi:hypothetical protein
MHLAIICSRSYPRHHPSIGPEPAAVHPCCSPTLPPCADSLGAAMSSEGCCSSMETALLEKEVNHRGVITN